MVRPYPSAGLASARVPVSTAWLHACRGRAASRSWPAAVLWRGAGPGGRLGLAGGWEKCGGSQGAAPPHVLSLWLCPHRVCGVYRREKMNGKAVLFV